MLYENLNTQKPNTNQIINCDIHKLKRGRNVGANGQGQEDHNGFRP